MVTIFPSQGCLEKLEKREEEEMEGTHRRRSGGRTEVGGGDGGEGQR